MRKMMGYAYEAEWRPLDLRRRSITGPYDHDLIVLRGIDRRNPTNPPRYLVGRMITENGVTWFHPSNGIAFRPAMERKRDYRWIQIPDEDLEEARQ